MRFIVETTLKQAPTDEVLALIPAESEHGRMLDAQGHREQLYLAADQSKGWQIFRGETLEDVQALMATFPLYPFMNVTITPLAEDMRS
jgi:muconolactone delta-isomerase